MQRVDDGSDPVGPPGRARRLNEAQPRAARSAIRRCRRGEQATERVCSLDRPAIIGALQTGPIETGLGTVRLEDNMVKDGLQLIGQWQNGSFIAVAPQRAGASALAISKPAWRQ